MPFTTLRLINIRIAQKGDLIGCRNNPIFQILFPKKSIDESRFSRIEFSLVYQEIAFRKENEEDEEVVIIMIMLNVVLYVVLKTQ